MSLRADSRSPYREQTATPSFPYSSHILQVSSRNRCQQLTKKASRNCAAHPMESSSLCLSNRSRGFSPKMCMYSSGGSPSLSSFGNRSARQKYSSEVLKRSRNFVMSMKRQITASRSSGSSWSGYDSMLIPVFYRHLEGKESRSQGGRIVSNGRPNRSLQAVPEGEGTSG